MRNAHVNSLIKSPFALFQLLLLFIAGPLLAQELLSSSVPDPYRWLEDSHHPRTQEWLNDQQNLFNQYIQSNSHRGEIKKTLQRLLDYESYSIPVCSAGSIFFKQRLPGENQPALYVQNGLEGAPRLLINPNAMSVSQTIALADFSPSPDGKRVAFGLAESGSDWTKWGIMDVATRETTSDCLERIKFFPVVWSPDGQGLFYTRLDGDDVYRIYYHALGATQASDPLIYENPAGPEFFPTLSISSDQHYLIVNLMLGSSGANAILYRVLEQPDAPFLSLLTMKTGNYSYLCNDGTAFYFWTNQDAPMGKVITLDAQSGNQEEIIPESPHALDQVHAVGKYFVAAFFEHAISRLKLYDRQGKEIRKIELPEMGSVAFAGAASSSEDQNGEIFLSLTHFVQPPLIYHYKIETDQLEVFKQPKLTFNPEDYETLQVFYSSQDGTQIPMFIVHKKGLELTGDHELLLYGYGGFAISCTPSYSNLHMAWLENGGIFALANIRGGGEYGKKWHEAGRKDKKQNSFDDFISAAEWLIGHGYTNASKLAIRGASNGGLLTAACINQRPDLFGAALVEVGVLDMLRFHLFTVGRFWMVEYGNPEDPEDFKVLFRYSPYHNVQKSRPYPPILIVTGDHDDRVVPLHSYKYTAALQEALDGKGSILLRVDRQGGHGAGKSLSQWIEEAADILSFLKFELSNQSG